MNYLSNKDDIPGHIAIALIFARKELGKNEKIIVSKGIIKIVDKTLLDRAFDLLVKKIKGI